MLQHVKSHDPSAQVRVTGGQCQTAPTLSITVLNYNYGRFLPACLDSILAQTFDDFEVIIIDDCSTDNSREIIKPYLRDPRIRVIAHERNLGSVASLIEGTEVHSRGEFLTVISADDVIRHPNAFARQIELLRRHPRAVFCFSAHDRFSGETGAILDVARLFSQDRVLDSRSAFYALLTDINVQVLHSGTIIRKTAYQACGGYRKDFKLTVDFALWTVLCLEGDVVYCADILYGWRRHERQMTQSFDKVWLFASEILQAVHIACTRAEQRGIAPRSLRKRAIQSNLLMMALDDAFDGRTRLALARCAAALLLRPVEIVQARAFWALLLRVALGQRLFDVVRGVVRSRRIV